MTELMLQNALQPHLRAAREAWAPLELSEEAFAAYVAERLPEGESAAARLVDVHLGDLYVACGCASGDALALKLLGERLWEDVRLAIRRLVPAGAGEDVEQRLRARLFLASGARAPRIADYIGRGPLAGWLRASAVREALTWLREHKREPPAGSELPELPLDDSPELALMRRQFDVSFRACFEAALEALPQRERSCLRLHLVAGAGIDQLGQVYGVHRATAARWIAAARERLLTTTRACLLQKLKLSEASLDSLFRAMDQQLDVSLQRMLEAEP